MIINENTSTAQNHTQAQSKKFGLEMSSMISKILYTHLYEDKEKVALQELSSNALDAHIAAGKRDVPIRIKLPTELDPELVVEDFGVGMDRHTVDTIYTSWGGSTKRDNNNEIGGFGYGSKTPLALAGSYSVETTYNGVTTMLACYLDEGEPYFSVFSEENIGRHDGTIVRVPVSDKHVISRLNHVASYLFTFWETTPCVTNGNSTKQLETIAETKQKVVEKEDKYFLVSDTWTFRLFNNTLTVGPVSYRIPDALITSLADTNGTSESSYTLLLNILKDKQLGLIPRFAIGELEISPSREFIEPTTDNLLKLRQYFDSLYERLSEVSYDASFSTYKKGVDTLYDNLLYVEDINGDKVPAALTIKARDELAKIFQANPTTLLERVTAAKVYDNKVDCRSWRQELLKLGEIENSKYAGNGSNSCKNLPTFTRMHKNGSVRVFTDFVDIMSILTTTDTAILEGALLNIVASVYVDTPVSTVSYGYGNKRIGRSYSRFRFTGIRMLDEIQGSKRTNFVFTDQENRKIYPLCRQLLLSSDKVYVVPTHHEAHVRKLLALVEAQVGNIADIYTFAEDEVNRAYKDRPKAKRTATTSGKRTAQADVVIGEVFGPLAKSSDSITYKQLEDITNTFPGIDRLVIVRKRDLVSIEYYVNHSSYSPCPTFDKMFLCNTVTIAVQASSLATKKFAAIVKELEKKIKVYSLANKNTCITSDLQNILVKEPEYKLLKETLEYNNNIISVLLNDKYFVSQNGIGNLVTKLDAAFPKLFKKTKVGDEFKVLCSRANNFSNPDKNLLNDDQLPDKLAGKLLKFVFRAVLNKTEDNHETVFSVREQRITKQAILALLTKEV